VSPRLVADLAAALKEPPEASEIAVRVLLAELPSPPPFAELVELAARARRAWASEEELRLALGTLLALHAPPSEPVGPGP